jgi:hypothetical protein
MIGVCIAPPADAPSDGEPVPLLDEHAALIITATASETGVFRSAMCEFLAAIVRHDVSRDVLSSEPKSSQLRPDVALTRRRIQVRSIYLRRRYFIGKRREG